MDHVWFDLLVREFILCCNIHVNIGHPVVLCGIKSFGSLMVSVVTCFINVLALLYWFISMLMNITLQWNRLSALIQKLEGVFTLLSQN